MLAGHIIHIGNAQYTAQLLGGHFHRPRRRRLARLRLRKRGRAGRVKRDFSLYLLHGLMNVPVENSYRTKLFQVRESLRAVFSSPSPVRIHRPQRDVREDHDWRAGLQMLDVFFQPLQLLVPQRTQSTGLQVHDVDQSYEVHTFLFEAVPAPWLRSFGETLVIFFAVVVQYIVLTGDVENILRGGALQNLLNAVEFFRLREMADIPRMQQEFRRRRQRVNFIDSSLQGSRNIRIRRLVETHVTVADLHETQLALHVARAHLCKAAHAVGFQNAALHDAERARSRPRHAFQEAAAIDPILIVIVQDLVLYVASHFSSSVDTSSHCIHMYAPPAAALIGQERRGLERASVPAPPWDVFHLCRPRRAARYSKFPRSLLQNYFALRI